ncbi:hypothetical protein [Glycomyces buryatensis]|uniref:Uncharacterized protein n=1 Tax=Glycomyces buryatensis TaxID=2570927 RepID=A0A4S8QAV4_9ACTN|nr:hypothetical protein [Glycomyces buryatensis]THV41468.1 hypothetical protein FAB82_11775 [Glycomyces buryatensis]
MNEFAELHGLSHREVASRLVLNGWSVCGVGDWATAWRSPEGFQVARVSPFELAYGVFVDLCRDLDGHALLPRIDFDAPLRGGGRVTVMEFLRPAEEPEVAAVTERWEAGAADDPVGAVRLEAERLSDKAESVIPYWGGVDLNPGNIMVDLSGQVKLVDLFFSAGHLIFSGLTQNPTEFAARIPAGHRDYITEIGCAARVWTPAEIARYGGAAAALSRD